MVIIFSVKHSRTHTHTSAHPTASWCASDECTFDFDTLLFRVARSERRKEKASVFIHKRRENSAKKSSGRREIEPRTAHHKHTERGEERLSKSTNKRRSTDRRRRRERAQSSERRRDSTDRQLELQLSRRTVRFLAEFRAAKVIFAIFVLFRKEGRFLRLVREREEKVQIFVSWFLRAVCWKRGVDAHKYAKYGAVCLLKSKKFRGEKCFGGDYFRFV